MEIERILAMGDTDKSTLNMILSNRADFFIPEINSAAISVRKFGVVEDDLIKWRDGRLAAFRVEVAAALEKLRDKVQVALTAETLESLTLRQEIMIDGIDATIEKLGLAPGKDGK